MSDSGKIRRGQGPHGSRRGVALVVVLLMLALITILVSEFAFNIRIHTLLASNYEAKTQARYIARAGQNAAKGLITAGVRPDNENLFNNAAIGIQLFNWNCLTPPMYGSMLLGLSQDQGLFPEEEEEEEQAQDFDFTDMDGCGAWSLAIPYVLDETPLDLQIFDEQGRINLNAMLTRQANPLEPEFKKDPVVYHMILELFMYQMVMKEIELEFTPEEILMEIQNYSDCCQIDGSFDTDTVPYYEYDDRIIPMKDGPYDTVDEIRVIPGINDELYDSVKDFLTVYPTFVDGQKSDGRININAAPVEVLYSLIRACSYVNDDPTVEPDVALAAANEMITTAYSGGLAISADGKPTGTVNMQAQTPQYGRKMPSQIQNNAALKNCFNKMSKNPGEAPRFYRVVSTALTEDGLETTITKVIRVGGGPVTTLYYRED